MRQFMGNPQNARSRFAWAMATSIVAIAPLSNAQTIVQVDAAGTYTSPTFPSGTNILPVWNTLSIFDISQYSQLADYMYPFVNRTVMNGATGGRCYGDPICTSVWEMYSEDAAGSPQYDFSRSNTFFTAIDNQRAANIQPIISIGSTPAQLSTTPTNYGDFRAIIGEPKSYPKYREYIRRLIQAMIGYYGINTVSNMEFRLLWEADNIDIWNPQGGRSPFEEYKVIWQETVAGMRAGGIAKPILNPSNLMIAYSANGRTSWLNDFAAFLQSQTSVATINRFSFSLYGELNQPIYPGLGNNPTSLSQFANEIRNIIRTRFPTAEIAVDEGGLLRDENGIEMTGTDGTELGAAWNALAMKRALDDNWRYFATWFYSTAGDKEARTLFRGVKTPSFFAVSMLELLRGNKRIPVSYAALPNDRTFESLASIEPNGRVGTMLISYSSNRANQSENDYLLVFSGLKPNTTYYVKQYRVDRNHSNFSTAWLADVNRWGIKILPNKSKYDGFFSSNISNSPSDIALGAPYPNPKAFWDGNQHLYEMHAVFSHSEVDGSRTISTNNSGQFQYFLRLSANAIAYLDIVQFRGHDTYRNTNVSKTIYPKSNRFAGPTSGIILNDSRSDLAATGVFGWGSIPIAAPRNDGNFTVYNNGVADFPGFASAPFTRIVTGNFDGDVNGFSDFAALGGTRWASLPLAINNGNGNFTTKNNFIGNFPRLSSDPRSKVFVGNKNNDARDDIFLVGSPDIEGISVAIPVGSANSWSYLNWRSKAFSDLASHPKAKILAGNFDNDGGRTTDFAVVGVPGLTTIPLALGMAGGTFQFRNLTINNFPEWASHPSAEVIVGNFDGMGGDDLAITGVPGWGSVPVARSTGTGTSFTFTVVNTGVVDFPTWSTVPTAKFVVGDFNSDWRTDIAIVGVPGWYSIPVIQGRPDGTWNLVNFGLATFPGLSATPGVEIELGDYNGDTRMDIALTGVPGWTNIPIAYGQTNGSFTAASPNVVDFPSFTAAVNPK